MNGNDRRTFLKTSLAPAGLALAGGLSAEALQQPASRKPNVLFLMADQFRFDAIAALGNTQIYTPNIDRLVKRGAAFTQAYSPCPVCVPARYIIRTGCLPPTTRIFMNGKAQPAPGQPAGMTERCGSYLAATMKRLGYRTFGIGKFHTQPWDEALGYDVHLHSEELYSTPDQRRRDSYAHWIATEHAPFNYVEGLMGERTEMYYMPQARPTPPEVAVEGWASQRAVEQIGKEGDQPFFGFVSFVGPHPPLAPPIPFNRLYNPDKMPNPVCGKIEEDHLDEQIPWMNYAIWAENVNDEHARVLRARYYGTITYIDDCIGRILDAVEARGDASNTLICFFSDHGDHLGDHHGWQKESFFEASAHVPFLVSWPGRIPAGITRRQLVSLTDLFGLATSAAGAPELREGVDLIGALTKDEPTRDHLLGFYGVPGTPQYKVMVRKGDWKYIYMANGGRQQLFDLKNDPNELRNLVSGKQEQAHEMRALAAQATKHADLHEAMDGESLRSFPFAARELTRIYQFDRSRGITGFPENPAEVVARWRARRPVGG